MKRYLFVFILFFLGFFGVSQIANQEVNNTTTETFLKEYNAKNYKALYKLLNKDFQKQLSEKEFSDFIKYNLYDQYKDIITITYNNVNEQFYVYTAECTNGKLILNIACDMDGKISLMQWLPYLEKLPEVPTLKNITFLTDNPKVSSWDLKVDSIVNVYLKNSMNCGLSIAICTDTTITYYNYGETKRGNNKLPTPATIYEIGSISKTFTGILFADAIITKKVKQNDAVKKYLGDNFKNLAFQGKPIELVHLANHTARIHTVPNDLTKQENFSLLNPYANYTKEMVLNYVSTMSIDTFPGTKSEYSNLGMGLLGIVLEKVYSKSYQELISDVICKPLNLNDTKIVLNDEQKTRFATGYTTEGIETPYWDLGGLEGAGGIRSTSKDLMKYVRANMQDANPAFKLSHYSTFNDGRNNIALAWHIFNTRKSNELIWHNGRTGGFASFCGFIKSKKVAVVVLSNSSNPVDQIALGLLKLLQ